MSMGTTGQWRWFCMSEERYPVPQPASSAQPILRPARWRSRKRKKISRIPRGSCSRSCGWHGSTEDRNLLEGTFGLPIFGPKVMKALALEVLQRLANSLLEGHGRLPAKFGADESGIARVAADIDASLLLGKRPEDRIGNAHRGADEIGR